MVIRMVAILGVLVVACFLLVDWIVQLIAARREEPLGDPRRSAEEGVV